jgi:enoyl-CoA hydratase
MGNTVPITQRLHDSGVLELVIDIPPVNAVDIAHLTELTSLVESIDTRSDVRVLLLRSQGRGFIGGGDVKEVQRLPEHTGILGQANGSWAISVALHECAVPVIAAIHGYCIGLGVLIAGACDIVVAAEGTVFVLAEVDNGATGGAIQASGLMSDKRLRAAMFTCDPVPAEELYRYGTIYRLAAPEDLVDTALGVAGKIASKPPRVIRAAKKAINGSTGRDIRNLYRQELSYTYELNLMGDAHDARETFIDGSRAGYRTST